MTKNVYEIVGKVVGFLDKNPENGRERLERFLESGDKLLFSTEDVMDMTGWSRAHIIRLCRRGDLPHIPGNPHKFLYQPLVDSLHRLLVGGEYGRKKSRIKAGGSLSHTKKDHNAK